MKMSGRMPVCEIAAPESQIFLVCMPGCFFVHKAFCKSCSAAATDLLVGVWELTVTCLCLNKGVYCLHKSISRNTRTSSRNKDVTSIILDFVYMPEPLLVLTCSWL